MKYKLSTGLLLATGLVALSSTIVLLSLKSTKDLASKNTQSSTSYI